MGCSILNVSMKCMFHFSGGLNPSEIAQQKCIRLLTDFGLCFERKLCLWWFCQRFGASRKLSLQAGLGVEMPIHDHCVS